MHGTQDVRNGDREMTRVVHCKKEPFDVYIGRPSKWGPIHYRGRWRTKCYCTKPTSDPRPTYGFLHGEVGSRLLVPSKPCHGDVLIRLMEEKAERGERGLSQRGTRGSALPGGLRKDGQTE